jgi:hypothetical protein
LWLAALVTAPSAFAQTTFSIDFGGPTKGVPDTCAGVPITEGDILVPVTGVPAPGPLPPPCIAISGGFGPPAPGLGLFLHPACIGSPPGAACGVEVNALSYGLDGPAMPLMPPGSWFFSVDEFAIGLIGTPAPPCAWSEGPGAGIFDSAADAFVDLGLPPGPIPPALVVGNTGAIDGDGLVSFSGTTYPGLGLIEPNFPGFPPDTGDNIDALDVDGPIAALGVFFSLDAGFVCPATGIAGTGSALAHGFPPSAVLLTVAPGGPPIVYAPPPLLGLGLVAGPLMDDIDALAVFENGVPGYMPSVVPYDWLGGGTDMVLFSVRCGSAVIGMPDSIFGAPIGPGDILTTPLPAAFGGVSPFPGKLIPGEALGLNTLVIGPFPPSELDALDVVRTPLFDCNGNGIEDAVDIAIGGFPDCNSDGIIDTCQGYPPVTYCTAKTNSCGGTPAISLTGCPSASNPGAGFGGTAFTVAGSGARYLKSGLVIYTASGRRVPAIPFQCAPSGAPCGWLCLLSPIRRSPVILESGASPGMCDGSFAMDMNAFAAGNIGGAPAPYLAVPGTTVDLQIWGRDTMANGAYLSDAGEYVVLP